MYSRKNSDLNFLPVFGDLGTLIIALFILIIVIILGQLATSEKPITINTDSFFVSGAYELNKPDSLKLDSLIRNSHFTSIKEAYEKRRLVNIRIEGHTDPNKLKKSALEIVNNNRLSFLRAEQVGLIIENIIKDSLDDIKSINDLINKIVLVGYGSKSRDFRYTEKTEDDKLYHVYKKIDGEPNDTLFSYFTEDSAQDHTFQLLRRVVIKPVLIL